jgi:hypothetical protein
VPSSADVPKEHCGVAKRIREQSMKEIANININNININNNEYQAIFLSACFLLLNIGIHVLVSSMSHRRTLSTAQLLLRYPEPPDEWNKTKHNICPFRVFLVPRVVRKLKDTHSPRLD